MLRTMLLEWLAGRPHTVTELAGRAGRRPDEIVEDIRHLRLSLAHRSARLIVEPAECKKCGFRFGADKIRKPGRCPECRGTWISEPTFRAEIQDSDRIERKE